MSRWHWGMKYVAIDLIEIHFSLNQDDREVRDDNFGIFVPWWRHQMETFSALLALCAGNSPVSGEFPAQRPMTRSFDVFFYLHLIKRLSKHSRGWWFETLLRPLWRHCNAYSFLWDFSWNTIFTDSMVIKKYLYRCWRGIEWASIERNQYTDVIMSTTASQITSVSIVCSTLSLNVLIPVKSTTIYHW